MSHGSTSNHVYNHHTGPEVGRSWRLRLGAWVTVAVTVLGVGAVDGVSTANAASGVIAQVPQVNQSFNGGTNPKVGTVASTKAIGTPDQGTAPVLGSASAKADDGAYVAYETRVDARTVDLMVYSPALGGAAPVRVVLPTSYNADPAATFPVLYLLHGGSDRADYQSWTLYTPLYQNSVGLDIMMVFPSVGKDAYATNWWNFGKANKGNQYDTFVATELPQLLQRGYRASTRAAIAGVSSGGYSAIALAALHPGQYAAAGSFSGIDDLSSLATRTGVAFTLQREGENTQAMWGDAVVNSAIWDQHDISQPWALSSLVRSKTQVFVSSGDGTPGPYDAPGATTDDAEVGVVTTASSFAQKAHAAGVAVTTDLYSPGTHSWPYWYQELTVSWSMFAKALGSSFVLPDTGLSAPPAVTPAPLPTPGYADSRTARMIDTGIAIGADSNAYVWGWTAFGINGQSTGAGQAASTKVAGLPAGAIRSVSSGVYTANALDTSGNVWGWGLYKFRATGAASLAQTTPVKVTIGTSATPLSGVLQISDTEQAGAALDSTGSVWVWGEPAFGGGGYGKGAVQVTGLPSGAKAIRIKGGYNNFWITLDNGQVYSVGGNSGLPYLGQASATASAVPVPQLLPYAGHIAAIDSGINLGEAVLDTGVVLTWSLTGDSSRVGNRCTVVSWFCAGLPGLLTTADGTVLTGVYGLLSSYTGAIMLKDGNVWGFGTADDYGHFPTTPTLIDTGAVNIAAGQGFYWWQKADKTFWGQGYDAQGEIGLPISGAVTAKRLISWNLSPLAI